MEHYLWLAGFIITSIIYVGILKINLTAQADNYYSFSLLREAVGCLVALILWIFLWSYILSLTMFKATGLDVGYTFYLIGSCVNIYSFSFYFKNTRRGMVRDFTEISYAFSNGIETLVGDFIGFMKGEIGEEELNDYPKINDVVSGFSSIQAFVGLKAHVAHVTFEKVLNSNQLSGPERRSLMPMVIKNLTKEIPDASFANIPASILNEFIGALEDFSEANYSKDQLEELLVSRVSNFLIGSHDLCEVLTPNIANYYMVFTEMIDDLVLRVLSEDSSA